MSRHRLYGPASAHVARRQRHAARDPRADATDAVLFGAALRAAGSDEPARPGGVVNPLTRRLLKLAGDGRCAPCDLHRQPGGCCPNGHPLAGSGGWAGG